MMITLKSYLRLFVHSLHRWAVDPKVHTRLRMTAYVLSGLLLSAASLSHAPQPLTLGLICVLAGYEAAMVAGGGAVGYLLFWGAAGAQGVLWCALGLLGALALGNRRMSLQTPLLLPAIAGLVTALSGVLFQSLLGDQTSIAMYLLRIGLSMGVTRLFAIVTVRRDSVADWLACALAVLALAQIAPIPWLSLGFLAAGALGVGGAFPAAALAGLALDLSQVTKVSMTGVLCMCCFARFLPLKRWMRAALPVLCFPAVAILCGVWDLTPLPALAIGGVLGLFLPGQPAYSRRRGEVGIAQVRLEMTAAVFGQMQQLLLEAVQPPIDEAFLIRGAAERACGSCPCRKTCSAKEQAEQISSQVLHFPILEHSVPLACRKSGRLIAELKRSQEQLRQLRSGRARQEECRSAVVQQYQFLGEFMQDLSDELGQRLRTYGTRFQPQVVFCGNRPAEENGDRCLSFPGVGGKYYVAICDGMGTGAGAVDEGKSAGSVLKRMLTAGFPAEYALRTLNSLCALRDRAGAVTVDLAEIHLDSGKVCLYKWGAAPSYLLTAYGYEKIGTAGPPPGLSVTEGRETALRLSLRRGEMLALLSDGVGGEDALRCNVPASDEPLGEIGARILESGAVTGSDDATVAMIRLDPAGLST